jgi:hypothetical protein
MSDKWDEIAAKWLREKYSMAEGGYVPEELASALRDAERAGRNRALDEAYMAWKDNYMDAGLAIEALKTKETPDE